jgi:hypothetical protein
MRIGVLTTLRDEAGSLPHFRAVLESWERHPAVEALVCSFYENDSSDATVSLLEQWLQHRHGHLRSEQLGQARLNDRQTLRTTRMATARNKALEPLLSESLDWLLVLDADLQFQARHLFDLHQVLQRHPAAAMACASALTNTPDMFGHSPWSYYDTYALADRKGRLGITCTSVPFWELEDRATWLCGRPVPVLSAFGGMALLPMTVVKRWQLSWDGREGCEHWHFCRGVWQSGAVLACPGIHPLVIQSEPRPLNPAYRQRRREELRRHWGRPRT